jgi:hypothetical protein
MIRPGDYEPPKKNEIVHVNGHTGNEASAFQDGETQTDTDSSPGYGNGPGNIPLDNGGNGGFASLYDMIDTDRVVTVSAAAEEYDLSATAVPEMSESENADTQYPTDNVLPDSALPDVSGNAGEEADFAANAEEQSTSDVPQPENPADSIDALFAGMPVGRPEERAPAPEFKNSDMSEVSISYTETAVDTNFVPPAATIGTDDADVQSVSHEIITPSRATDSRERNKETEMSNNIDFSDFEQDEWILDLIAEHPDLTFPQAQILRLVCSKRMSDTDLAETEFLVRHMRKKRAA